MEGKGNNRQVKQIRKSKKETKEQWEDVSKRQIQEEKTLKIHQEIIRNSEYNKNRKIN